MGDLQVAVSPARPGLHVHAEHGALPGEAVVVERHWQPARGRHVAQQDVCYGGGTLQTCSWLSAPGQQLGAPNVSRRPHLSRISESMPANQQVHSCWSAADGPDTESAHACTCGIERSMAPRAQWTVYSRASTVLPCLARKPSCRDRQALGRKGSASGQPAGCKPAPAAHAVTLQHVNAHLARKPGCEDCINAVRCLHPGNIQRPAMDKHHNDGGVGCGGHSLQTPKQHTSLLDSSSKALPAMR